MNQNKVTWLTILRFTIRKISGHCVRLFGRPVPHGSWPAWACEPQVLSPVAATTCRVSMAAWDARRGSAKVRLNETFRAKIQHLYTTLTGHYLSWSARHIVCCELVQGSMRVH